MPAQTPHTITDPAVLLEQIRDDRVRGYAVDDGEQEIGVRCVAVPVAGGPSAIAISVSGPTARMTPELIDRAVPLLHAAATGCRPTCRRGPLGLTPRSRRPALGDALAPGSVGQRFARQKPILDAQIGHQRARDEQSCRG